MRRIERGQNVRGVSLKLQEEERERRMDYVPKESEIKTSHIRVDKATGEMLKDLGVQFDYNVDDRRRPRRFAGARGAPRGPRR